MFKFYRHKIIVSVNFQIKALECLGAYIEDLMIRIQFEKLKKYIQIVFIDGSLSIESNVLNF